jgi:hypothetical protein
MDALMEGRCRPEASWSREHHGNLFVRIQALADRAAATAAEATLLARK